MWLLLSASAALAVIYGAHQVRDAPGLARSVVKTGAILTLAAVTVICAGPWLLVLALVVSAVGDWMLSRAGEGAFLAGVASFAAGHVSYIALFLAVPGAGLAQMGLGDTALAWALLILGLAMAVLLWPRVGALRGPVMAYLVIILGMGGAALMVPWEEAFRWILPGAILFVASDTVLALERFVFGENHPGHAYMARFVWASYWAAQVAFTMAFCL